MYFLGLGDVAFSTVIGMVVSFLPVDNILQQCLNKNPTTYKLLQMIVTLSDFKQSLRTFRYNTCKKGCRPFDEGQNFCAKCEECRWKNCCQSCFDDEGNAVCRHQRVPKVVFYYMPLRDRITALLQSDLNNFFSYSAYRKRSPQVC
jgi:hypothetical protein